MKISRKCTMAGAALMTGLFTLTQNGLAVGQEPAPEKTKALLEQVKKTELNRQVAVKQTAIDRLQEDLEKSKKDAEGLQQTMTTTATLINESVAHLDSLS